MAMIHIRLLGGFEVAVDTVPVPAGNWSRRHAAALVKVLAIAPGRRLHREQVIDLVWPDDTVGEAVPKLHKAAHFARRAIDVTNAVVLRGDNVMLTPEVETTIDVDRFEDLARQALGTEDAALAREAIAAYRGELLPEDRYEPWAEKRRDQLQLRYLELLRFDGDWEKVVELDPGDEAAHLALMRLHAAKGDRHAALRQFERMDRALRRELGVAPGSDAVTLRDRLRTGLDAGPPAEPRHDTALIGRDAELAAAERALTAAAAGHSATLLLTGPAGVGKSALLAAITASATRRGFRIGHGMSAPVEGSWPYAPVVEALADLCRSHPGLLDGLAVRYREEIDRALAGAELAWTGEGTHQRLFVAAAELVRLASATTPLLLTIDDVHDADDASLRLLHYIARSTRDRHICITITHRPAPLAGTLAETRRSLLDRHGATEVALGPLDSAGVAALVRRHVEEPDAGLLEQIATLGRGIPFAVAELARNAAGEHHAHGAAGTAGWVPALDATILGGIEPATREALQRVAVAGAAFDTDEFVALSGIAEADAFDHLDAALAAEVVEPSATGYRFRHGLVRDALLDAIPPHRRRRIHRDAASRLIELGASAVRIGHHLLHSGTPAGAVPYLLRAAGTEAAVGAYRDALALVEALRPHANTVERGVALALRADLLNAIGDPLATSAYREALDGAEPAAARRLRVRLARCAVMAGDVDTASAAIAGIETDGGAEDADILLARGKCAYFRSDYVTAQAAADAAQELILAGDRNWVVLDLVSLQGMLAHSTDSWFDRMRLELRRTRENPEIANAIFDGYLCPAEYMLYGPMPYAEVIELARDMRTTARRSGAVRAEAFAAALIGEAAFLSGDLALAAVELAESVDLHHELGSGAGEAHSLQRLSEVHLAKGDAATATALCRQAFPLARGSYVARHLLQRIFGTMILAAADPQEARALVDRAEAAEGWDDVCLFCSIMFSVPATLACVRAGDLPAARRHLADAERATALWAGTAWEAATSEAQAVVAMADGDPDRARTRMRAAAELFQRTGQPLDEARCRAALAAY
ncbi:ATP-binding protein [Pseudonocardia sp. GCM10023141]|uniref:ATP-binding protein n=1 Tax=Pseudonocardia sp. GCM10023141 TaxID=3252653 RepID=UPI00361484B8